MTGTRLVVFDVDGTLVDSQVQILAAMTASFAYLGLVVPPRAEILGIVGLSLPQAMARLAPDQSPALQDALVAGYKAAYMDARALSAEAATAPLYPGARETLVVLGRVPDTVLGIATGKSRRGLDHLLVAHGLTHHFVTQQVADDHPSKPDPSMLRACLRETGAVATDAVMIGDTEFDMAMARAAGFRAIGVTWGYHDPARLLRAGAHCLVTGFEDLTAALQTQWKTPA